MRTIIAGGRDITDYGKLLAAVAACPWKITTVVNGGARGVDTMAVRWASENHIMSLTYSADWGTHGKVAGPMRNRLMAADAQALLALWDGQSPGTRNMIEEARNNKLRIHIFRVDVDLDWL